MLDLQNQPDLNGHFPTVNLDKLATKIGRPVRAFTPQDWETVDKLCSLMCTAQEIAGFLDVSVDTLYRRIKETHDCTFAEYFDQKKVGAQIALRRAQWQSAMNGNVSMQIFLGKQYLGQSNKMDVITAPAKEDDIYAAWKELEAQTSNKVNMID